MLVTDGKPHRLLEIIQAQGEIAAAGLDQARAMRAIVERVAGLIGADGALIDAAEEDQLVIRAGSGVDPGLIGWRYPRRASLSGLALARGSVLISRDTRDDARVEAKTCRGIGARSLLCAPLVHRGEELGALTAYAARPARFDEEDREVIELLTPSLAAHLHHAAGFSLAAHLSLHDHLTGLQNRRAYERRLDREARETTRGRRELSLCLLDLDRFKDVNDRFGHVAGDAVLRAVARGFERRSLAADAFRIGGDEFAVLFPGHGPAAAREAIRQLVAGLDLGNLAGRGVSIGISCGIATGRRDPWALHAAADQRLTTTKRLRRVERVPGAPTSSLSLFHDEGDRERLAAAPARFARHVDR